MSTTIRRSRKQRGAAMIESALTLPIFLFFTFGLFDFSWVLFRHQVFVHQAQTAARYGAVNPTDLTAIKNMALYNNPAGGTVGLFGLQPANVTVARNGQGTTADRIVVTISNVVFNFVSPGHSGNFTGQPITAVANVEN